MRKTEGRGQSLDVLQATAHAILRGLIAWNQWWRDENHFRAVLHTQNYDLRHFRRVSWSIVSKAADKSSRTNPQIRQSSRREMSKKGLVQSRIDFWLVSVALEYQITSTSIKPGNSSDHNIIKFGIELLETQNRGKGYWKFNNSLLKDQNYVNTIRKILQRIKSEVTMENKNQLWDFVKCRIRGETIDYSIKKARENKKRKGANRFTHDFRKRINKL